MKSFLSPLWLSSIMLMTIALMTGRPACADEVTLQNDSWVASFNSDSGALTRLENRAIHWTIERRPQLGISFRLNAPLDQHDNFVLGQNQHPVEVKKLSDQQIRMQWKDLASERGGVLPMTLTAVVSLTNDALTFATTLENDSTVMVSTVDFPCLGDLSQPSKTESIWGEHMWYADLKDTPIPGPAIQSKQSLFCLIQSTNKGLYVEMQDPTQPYLLNFNFEHRGMPKSPGPSRVEFSASHFAYVHPHTTVALAPVVLRGYAGDWHAGVDRYKEWRATWFKPPHLAKWIEDVNSWQQLQIGSPEQDWRVPYTNLLQYGEECASNGVSAIQLVGWNNGGQDGGDPAQDIDPGLGTWQELHDAIAQIQAKGVKIILFAKLNWADLTMPRYTNEFYKYQCTDENGKRYEQGGYSYYTPTQLAGLNNHRRAVMDFMDPQYREVATTEFKKILALGSEGWLWDEVCHHASVFYSWAPNHGYTAPGYIYGGDMPLGAQLRTAADKVSPDFLFSGEGPEDWLMQYFPCSYFRIGSASKPVCRYIDSQAPLMVAVTGFDDREMLNLILLDRYIISYEPYNFKGHLSDYPLTLNYGRKIDALRRKYKAYLWDAEFKDTLGASINADGAARYSVFVAASGKRAVVLINTELNKPVTVSVNLPNSGKLMVATPEQPETRPTDGTVELPARSAAVLMEQ